MGRESKIGHKTVASFDPEALAAAGIGFEGKTPVMVRWTLARGLLAALIVLSSVPLSLGLGACLGESSAYAQGVIQNIRVEGNKRVEPETVRSYLTFSTGDAYDPAQVDESLKALFATGLFQDVRIKREGATIVIVVIENPIVARVAFEGNREVEDDALASEVQLKARAVYTRARVQADVQRILDIYRRQGYYAAQVDPKIINLDNNRIDVVFEINEGGSTKVRAINFIGNSAFSDSQLRYVISTTQTNLLSFLKSTNIYDPDRLNLDRELLRQFYLSIPRELEEAAVIDGAGKFRRWFQIVLPMTWTPLMTLGILTGVGVYNDFLWPLIAMQTKDMYTITVGISIVTSGAYVNNYGPLMAFSAVAAVPTIVLFIILQRHFVASAALSGVKG